jgi:HlyD family secretion protein
MMRGKTWTAGILILVGGLVWALTVRTSSAGTTYRFVEVTRGDLESTVTATGTLQATETVEVGTQVSGQVAEIYADFNDRVPQGQLIARIDATILEQEVRSAEVALARNQAEVDQARRDLERLSELNAKGVITDSEVEASEYRFALVDAGYQTAEINLERAQRNLEYSEIRAPIAGVVVARNVEVGQTVAASLSAPTLFVLAQDLAQMEILASVDESDIGQIAGGQKVHFTVQAYPDREYEGSVRQVRLQATTRENVVTYSVVVAVGNEDGSLLPGMTATLDIVIETAEDVLMVPNTALRFRATEEMQESVMMDRNPMEAAAERPLEGRSSDGERLGGQRQDGQRNATSIGGGGGTLWYIGEGSELRATRVRTGLSDGLQTVIVNAPDEVREGIQVIAAVTTSSVPSTVENPFQTQQQTQPGPGGRPGGR